MASDDLKFLVDVCVGRFVEEWLMVNGFNVKSVREIDPRMKDMDILEIAVQENRMVVTMDKDFGELVHNSGMVHSGVLLLRIEDANGEEKVRTIAKILRDYHTMLPNKFCVFQNGKLRIRK